MACLRPRIMRALQALAFVASAPGDPMAAPTNPHSTSAPIRNRMRIVAAEGSGDFMSGVSTRAAARAGGVLFGGRRSLRSGRWATAIVTAGHSFNLYRGMHDI